jgi:HlyD family secretion protein
MSESHSKSDLFRKVAMDRLSSPEQLDSLMRIITPQAWLALVPLLVMMALALVWGWFGSVPTKLQADKCILINPSGLADVTSETNGRITSLLVKVGDDLTVGAPVARVAQPDLLARMEKTRSRLNELLAQSSVMRTMDTQTQTLAIEGALQQTLLLQGQMRAANERSGNAQERGRVARERAAVQAELFGQGLVTNSSVLFAQQEVVVARQDEVAAQLEVENLKTQKEQLKLQTLERERQRRSEASSTAAQISEIRRQIDTLQQQIDSAVTVTSTHAGRVTEIKAGSGMLVGSGMPVVTLELPNQGQVPLQAALYIPVGEGRKLQPNMAVQVVPSTVRREEFGALVGRVTRVSDYPTTPQSMMLMLQNDPLVRDLAGTAPPVEVRVSLKLADSYSGYEWTSRKGPNVKLASGTLCKSEVTINSQRPLGLVIPALNRLTDSL